MPRKKKIEVDLDAPMWREHEMRKYYNTSSSTIWRWVKNGTIEAPEKIGGSNRWRRSNHVKDAA
jgi:predicted DNA-binding transcriptional regulator AlpA